MKSSEMLRYPCEMAHDEKRRQPREPIEARTYRFGDWTFHPHLAQLAHGNRIVEAEPKVLRLLQMLIEERKRVVGKEELLERVWNGAYVSDNALTRAAARLRSALGDDARSPQFVQTIHGLGYRFIATVTEETADEPRTSVSQRPRQDLRARSLLIVLLGAAMITALGLYLARPTIDPQSAVDLQPTRPELDPRRIAVLPLRHIGPDAADSYLADGFTEQMVSVLTQIDEVRVIARASTRALDDRTLSAGTIGRDLGAGSLLQGSVRTTGSRLRLVLHLVDVTSEEVRWSKEFDATVEDLLAAQTEIAVQVAEALETTIAPSRLPQLGRHPTAEATAYKFYLEGRRAYRKRTRSDNEEAILRFRQALTIDPNFALGESGLANAYAMRVIRWGFPNEWLDRAEAAARRALTLNPELPHAFKALAMVAHSRGRISESLSLNLEALEQDPDFDEALYNGAAMASLLGRWDLALELQSRDRGQVGRSGLPTYLLELGFDTAGWRVAEQVLAKEPLAGYTQLYLAYHNMLTGDHAAARERLAAMRSAYPDWSRTWRQSGELETWAGDLDSAWPYFEEAIRRAEQGNPEATVRLAGLLVSRGRHDKARPLLELVEREALEQIESGNETWLPRWLLAATASVRQQPTAVVDWLTQALEHGFNHALQHHTDPLFSAFHDEPGYRALGDRMDRELAEMREASQSIVANLGLPID